MAQGVVYVLEAVQVHEQHRYPGAVFFRHVRRRAFPRRSTKAWRLGSPVRRSWEARRSSSASRALRSEMSVETPIMAATFPRSSNMGVAVPNMGTREPSLRLSSISADEVLPARSSERTSSASSSNSSGTVRSLRLPPASSEDQP